MQDPLPLKSCCICNKPIVSKITYIDKPAPDCPAFWCSDCYIDLHYDEDMQCIDCEHRPRAFPTVPGEQRTITCCDCCTKYARGRIL